MIFAILTIFPEIFRSPLSESLIKKALDKGILQVRIRNLRDFTEDKHRTTDDYPYGGGAGMVMKADPIFRAVEEIKSNHPEARTILLSPQGERFHQGLARDLSRQKHWVLICGRYEGLDERVRLGVIDGEISIGDYVLNGGEIPAHVFLELVSRYVPGFLGSEQSALFTLAITGLRLVGELMRWSPALFSREAGGGGAIVGIGWLIPILGILFALRLASAGHAPPKAGPVLGWAALAFVINTLVAVGAFATKLGPTVQVTLFAASSIGTVRIAWRGWPQLARILLGYAFAARIPVVLVMLVAIGFTDSVQAICPVTRA